MPNGCCLFFCKPYGTGHENYNKKFAHSLTHLLVQLLHAHKVDGLEPVARRADEVEADVNAAVVVHGEVPLNLQLLLQTGWKKTRFFLKTQPNGFFGFFCPEERVFRVFFQFHEYF
jgi:hypothetical protein